MYLSIVIPVYNAERYLASSVGPLAASLPNAWELVIIDDGSTDDSLAYCRLWERDNVRVFTQPNAGPSAARNRGIREASGEYVTFLDADDAFAPGTLEAACEYLQKTPTDALFLQVERIAADGSSSYLVAYDKEERIDNAALWHLWCQGSQKIKGFFWGKIYARNLLKGIALPEDMRFAEDMYVLSDIFAKVQTAALFPVGAYQYYERENTPTTGKWTAHKAYQLLRAYLHRWEIAEKNAQTIEEQLSAWSAMLILFVAEKKRFPDKQWNDIRREIKSNNYTLGRIFFYSKSLRKFLGILRNLHQLNKA